MLFIVVLSYVCLLRGLLVDLPLLLVVVRAAARRPPAVRAVLVVQGAPLRGLLLLPLEDLLLLLPVQLERRALVLAVVDLRDGSADALAGGLVLGLLLDCLLLEVQLLLPLLAPLILVAQLPRQLVGLGGSRAHAVCPVLMPCQRLRPRPCLRPAPGSPSGARGGGPPLLADGERARRAALMPSRCAHVPQMAHGVASLETLRGRDVT